MSTYARTVACGAVTLVVFDAIAALASRSLGFAYTRAAIGSYAICLLIGFLIGLDLEGRRPMQGVLAGLILGFTDATVGWIVAASLGAGKTHRHLTPITWLIVCWLVMATYTIFTSGGYGIAALIRKKRPLRPVA